MMRVCASSYLREVAAFVSRLRRFERALGGVCAFGSMAAPKRTIGGAYRGAGPWKAASTLGRVLRGQRFLAAIW
jgi:hypothetical protein